MNKSTKTVKNTMKLQTVKLIPGKLQELSQKDLMRVMGSGGRDNL